MIARDCSSVKNFVCDRTDGFGGSGGGRKRGRRDQSDALKVSH